MNRAVMYETFGGPEVLELREVPEPHAGPGEVRVRVAAVGLNPMDWGLVSRPEAVAQFGITVPSGFGYDFAGVIDEVGVGATGLPSAIGSTAARWAEPPPTSWWSRPPPIRPMRSFVRRTASATRWRARFRWPA
jgi:NADPH:quinone reductase-like Zn-dependent oxidoreductase